MGVTDYEKMMLPVLKLFAEGAQNVAETIDPLRRQLALTDEEALELLPSGRKTKLADRAHWARTYLSKAGLLASPKRNQHVITEAGRSLLATAPAKIDNETLTRFEGFGAWRSASRPQFGLVKETQAPDVAFDGKTPEDSMISAQAILDSALRDDLLLLL